MTPEQIYNRGDGTFNHEIELVSICTDEPTVKYRGPAKLIVNTLDRVKYKKQFKGYPNHDFWITVKDIRWSEYCRSDYEESYDCFIVEDYQMIILE